LEEESGINNGQPALHALCLAALSVKEGESVVHIGAGTGYYTAVLAELTGVTGKVFAYEIAQSLAQRATRNLADLPNVAVYQRSGTEGLLPDCEAIYVVREPRHRWIPGSMPCAQAGDCCFRSLLTAPEKYPDLEACC
jgi:protein-L-isoaspartate(D-aspartate) O-methyltransferase